MSNKKFKYSEKFQNGQLQIISEFLDINISSLISSIQGSTQAKQMLEKIEDIKSAVEDKLKESYVDESKKQENINEEDFVDFYKNQLTLIKYKDTPEQDYSYNMQSRAVVAEFCLGKEKQNLILEIDHEDTEGDKRIEGCLSYKIKEKIIESIWDWEEEDTYDFNTEIANKLFSKTKLDEVDKREVKYAIKDLTLAMIEFLEDKYGEEDEYGMSYGIEEEDLNMILKIQGMTAEAESSEDEDDD